MAEPPPTEAALIRMTDGGLIPGGGPSDGFTPLPADSTTAASRPGAPDDIAIATATCSADSRSDGSATVAAA